MSKPIRVKLNDYCKAVEICAYKVGYGYVKHRPKKGSVYSFELFQNKNDETPCVMWSVHCEHNKDKGVWGADLEKVWEKTAIPRDLFISTLKEMRKKYQNLK